MPARLMTWILIAILAVAAFIIVQALVPSYDPATAPPPPALAPASREAEARPARDVELDETAAAVAAGLAEPPPTESAAEPPEDLEDVRPLLEAFEIAAARGDRIAALSYLERAAERHPESERLRLAVDELRGPPPPATPPAVAADPPNAPTAATATTDPEAEEALRRRARGGFAVHFEGPEQMDLVQPALDLLQDAYLSVRQRLGITPAASVDVIIYTDGDYARSLATTQWEVARFDGKIRVSRTDLLAASGALRRVLFHEYLHAVLHQAPTVPAWFNEGLAQWVEPPAPQQRRELVWRAVSAGRQLPLTELRRGFLRYDSPRTAVLAYAQSLSLVEFMVAERGESRLRGFAQRLCAGETFDALVAETYADDPRRFEQAWLAWVRRGG